MKELLRQIKYFSMLGDNELLELESICKIKNFSIGDILFYEGTEPKYIYYLINGYIRLSKNQGNFKQVHINTMGPGMLIAEIIVFEEMDYPATAEVIQNAQILMIDRSEFMNTFFNNVNILQSMIKSLGMKIRYLMSSLELETTLTIEIKIAKYIIKNQKNIAIIKHKDIAIELNTTSETVSRILKKFVSNGLILSSNPIQFNNLKGLQVLCS